MSDDVIAKAIAQIADHETAAAHHNNEAVRLKAFVNTYDQFAGREPRYGDVTAPSPAGFVTVGVTPGSRGWSAGDFLGKPFATAAKAIMQARYELAGKPAPATVEEIHETLVQGTYDFGTSNADHQKHGIRIALGKNTAVFVRLPNSDLFGLIEWYPGLKRAPRVRPRLNGDQSAAHANFAEGGDGASTEESTEPARPEPRESQKTLADIGDVFADAAGRSGGTSDRKFTRRI